MSLIDAVWHEDQLSHQAGADVPKRVRCVWRNDQHAAGLILLPRPAIEGALGDTSRANDDFLVRMLMKRHRGSGVEHVLVHEGRLGSHSAFRYGEENPLRDSWRSAEHVVVKWHSASVGLGHGLVANRFDVVPVRTNDESCIVVPAVLRAQTRWTIVL